MGSSHGKGSSGSWAPTGCDDLEQDGWTPPGRWPVAPYAAEAGREAQEQAEGRGQAPPQTAPLGGEQQEQHRGLTGGSRV